MNVLHVAAPADYVDWSASWPNSARRGHVVVVPLVLEPGRKLPSWTGALQAGNVALEAIRVPARAYFRERGALRGLIRRVGADIVHTHGYQSDVLHRSVAASAGVPTDSTAHGFATTDGRGRVYEWLQLPSWRQFDDVVAVSDALCETLIRAGVPERKIEVIHNGLIPGAQRLPRDVARAQLGLPKDGPVVAWIGRLSAEKDPLLAVEGLARSAHQEAMLCIIGDGPLLQPTRDRAAALGLGSRCVFTGPLADASIYLNAFDGLALTSRTEGTPMVLLEAGSAGVPIVATAVGGVPELVGGNALVVPHGDAMAIGAALDQVLGAPLEAVRRAKALQTRLPQRED